MNEHTCMCVCVCLWGGRLASAVLLNLSWVTCVPHFLPSQQWDYTHTLLCLASPLPTVELHAHTAMPGFFPFFNFENFVCIYS